MAYKPDWRATAPMGLRVVIDVDGISPGMELAVKEDLAMAIEARYGRTVRVVSVTPKHENK